MTARIRVLVVDDSAFARKVMREVLSKDPAIEVVGIARDGLEALEKVAELQPDVVTLDLVMPELDGVGFLQALPKDDAPRVVVVSVSGSDTELALEALALGAVELVTKPTPLPTDRLYELSAELIRKVKLAAEARAPLMAAPAESPLNLPPRPAASAARLVVIGTSTGGPQALMQLFKRLPADFPAPIAIALHIPAGYTAPLAARLSQLGGPIVEEAGSGMVLRPGRAVIAPGGRHLTVTAVEGEFLAMVATEPRDSLYHPSVDLLFESAAKQVGSHALGLIMTGMGADGLQGARAIHRQGGRIFAESASSCVVYGMPRSVIEAGITSGQAPLDRLAELLTGTVGGVRRIA